MTNINMKIIKYLRILFLIVALLFCTLFFWMFNEGVLTKDVTILRFLIVGGTFFLFESFFIIISKECAAKGVIIRKDQHPVAYFVVLIIAATLCLISYIGAYFYS